MRDDDVRALLQAEAESAPQPRGLRPGTVRKARLRRAAFVSISLLTVLSLAVPMTLALKSRTNDRSDVVSPPEESPTAGEQGNYEWPDAFVPPTEPDDDRAALEAVFMDRTIARISYPQVLALAEMGVQTTISYAFTDERAQLGAAFDVIAVHGEIPDGLLGEELERFDATASGQAALHQVKGRGRLRGLRGNPPFALVFRSREWHFLATLPSREEAATVAENLHPSVTSEGWPSLFTTGPLQLSQGFGEARGPHLEFNDEDPRWDIHTRDTYVLMGVVSGCGEAEDGVSGGGRDSYAAKCLPFEGDELGIFVSIYGPEEFVRDLYGGLRLEET